MHGSLAGGYFWCDSFTRPMPLCTDRHRIALGDLFKGSCDLDPECERSRKCAGPPFPNIDHGNYASWYGWHSWYVHGTIHECVSVPAFPQRTEFTLTRSPKGLHKSLLMPLNLFPSSWRLHPTFILLQVQGGVLEETVLVVLAERYLDIQPTDRPSEVSLTLSLPSSRGSKFGRKYKSGMAFFPRSNALGGAVRGGILKGTAYPILCWWKNVMNRLQDLKAFGLNHGETRRTRSNLHYQDARPADLCHSGIRTRAP